MRALIAWLIVSLGVTALAQPADSAKDLKAMQGTWAGGFVEASGKPLEDKLKALKIKLVVKGDKYTVFIDEQKYTEGVLKLDAGKKPKTIDAIPTDGPFKDKLQPGIYQVEGDDLRTIFAKPGDERPSDFKTKEGSDQMLATYKRVKDAK